MSSIFYKGKNPIGAKEDNLGLYLEYNGDTYRRYIKSDGQPTLYWYYIDDDQWPTYLTDEQYNDMVSVTGMYAISELDPISGRVVSTTPVESANPLDVVRQYIKSVSMGRYEKGLQLGPKLDPNDNSLVDQLYCIWHDSDFAPLAIPYGMRISVLHCVDAEVKDNNYNAITLSRHVLITSESIRSLDAVSGVINLILRQNSQDTDSNGNETLSSNYEAIDIPYEIYEEHKLLINNLVASTNVTIKFVWRSHID